MNAIVHRPLICAHAGCEGLPLDGLEAVEAGIEAGADFVELDLRFTADGTAVLAHDALRGEAHRRLRTLDEALAVLARHPKVGLNIDVKDLRGLAEFPTPLTRGEVPNPFYCTGLKARQLPLFRKVCPGLAHTVDDLPWWFRFASPRARVSVLARYRAAGALALNLSYTLVDEALMAASQAAGLPVRVWTVDDLPALRRMIDLGVEAITTNRVVELARMLR